MVLDVGGACVGFVNALQTASLILSTGGHRAALLVASEVHSRVLASLGAPGEFRGLFSDGACALVLTPAREDGETPRVGSFTFGCSGEEHF